MLKMTRSWIVVALVCLVGTLRAIGHRVCANRAN